MIDNETMKPVYIEAKDTEWKAAAKRVFKTLFEQRVGHSNFAVEIVDVHELVRNDDTASQPTDPSTNTTGSSRLW